MTWQRQPQRPRRASRHRDRLADAQRRRQLRLRDHGTPTKPDGPQEHWYTFYGVITLGVTLVVWRFVHWSVSVSSGLDPNAVVSRRGDAAVVSQPDIPAWVDRVGRRLRPGHPGHLALHPQLQASVGRGAGPNFYGPPRIKLTH